MENASKALIMAASVLIAIVIISAFILMMSNLTSYQDASYRSNLSSQVAEFNNQYTTYIRDDVRGSDMISLMNKIVDYNNRYADTEGFTEMHITIHMNGQNEKLVYDEDYGNLLVIQDEYNETNITQIVGRPSSATNDISDGIIRELENKYEQKYCNQLASDIATIDSIRDNVNLSSSEKEDAFNAERLLPKPVSEYSGGLSQIYEDALVYYEYVQFKRAYFDCVGQPQYDQNTGRITGLEFECTGVGV